jgi:hypothetical protein
VIRQRINLRTPLLAYVVRAMTLLLGFALVWYGLMVVLLAVKASPHTVNSISAYRTLYHDVAGLTASDFTTARRLIAGIAGFLVFLACGYLALQEFPRPYRARGAFTIGERDRGETTIQPRTVERVVEIAATANPGVTSAAGRLGDEEVAVHIHVRSARAVGETLRDVHARTRNALSEHGLPTMPVNVTLTGYDRNTTRELS